MLLFALQRKTDTLFIQINTLNINFNRLSDMKTLFGFYAAPHSNTALSTTVDGC